jgi:hypothetical protein
VVDVQSSFVVASAALLQQFVRSAHVPVAVPEVPPVAEPDTPPVLVPGAPPVLVPDAPPVWAPDAPPDPLAVE